MAHIPWALAYIQRPFLFRPMSPPANHGSGLLNRKTDETAKKTIHRVAF